MVKQLEAVANYEYSGFCVSTWKSQELKLRKALLWLHLMDSEVQNITEAGRDLGDHLVQHTPLKAASATSAQGCVQFGFEYFSRMEAFLDKLFQCSTMLPQSRSFTALMCFRFSVVDSLIEKTCMCRIIMFSQ